MEQFLRKLQLTRYLSSKLIFAIDLFVSCVASLGTLFLFFILVNGLRINLHSALYWVLMALPSSAVMFYLLKTYRSIIRHSTLREVSHLALAALGKDLVMAVIVLFFPLQGFSGPLLSVLLVIDFLFTLCLLVLLRVMMILAYDLVVRHYGQSRKRHRVLVYGLMDKAVALVTRMKNSNHYNIIGFITPETAYKPHTLGNSKTYYFKTEADVAAIKRSLGVNAILFATPDDAKSEQEKLVKYAGACGLKVLIQPSIDEIVDGKVMKNQIREVKIEDLLGRPEIQISINKIMGNFQNKVVMVTGAAGSIGSELCRQLAGFGVKQLIMFDNAETPMHNIRLELEERFPSLSFVPIIGDVRQVARLDYAFRKYRPTVVFHAAAYKHVPLMEENPCEAVLVNVAGSRNVADKCIEYGVEKMVMVSTDKAVNPTNVMGCTKRLAEIYVQALGLAVEQHNKAVNAGGIKSECGESQPNTTKHSQFPDGVVKTKFVTTRFGNVLGSNGSVIPRFREQIAKGGPVTVTHPEITRFFMTIPEACRLVMEAATMTDGNQIFVFDMGKSVKIADMAHRMIELAGFVPNKDIMIEFTGLRPGEKLYEEVLSNAENTIPTDHSRIRIAMVREYDYEQARVAADELERLSRAVEIPDMVRLMKRTVPEFKSKNSIYEHYDKELEALSAAN